MIASVRHSDLLNTLGAQITSGELPDGEILRLTELEETFNVSRTVAREAMRVLESLGMVIAKRRVGLIIQPMERWVVLDPIVIGWRLSGSDRDNQIHSLTQLRVALEPTAARLAANSGNEIGREIVELAELLKELGESGQGNSEEYLRADIAFHRKIMTAGGNELFAALADAVTEVLEGRARHGLTPAHPDPASIEQHLSVARAIASGDGETAEGSTRALLEVVWAEVATA